MGSRNYKDLLVWQKAAELSVLIYELTDSFPKSELFGITSQMRRSSISIPSNIAEGSKRGTKKDFLYFLGISIGSGAELETQIYIAKRLPFGKNLSFQKAEDLLDEIMKMLNGLSHSLKTTNS